MAGDWIKWQRGLARKPEVLRLAARLGRSRHEIAGLLMEVWEWTDEQIADPDADGHANVRIESGQARAFIDHLTGLHGFADAMSAEGWIIFRSAHVTFPNWGRHNGKSAKRRALDAERKRKDRDDEPESPRKMSASDADKKRTRGEERRERDTSQPTSQPRLQAAPDASEPPDPGWLAGWKSGISELGAAGVLIAEQLATEAHGLGLKADEWLDRVRFAVATANAPENAAKLADRGGAIVSFLRRNCWPVAGIVGADKLRAKAEKRAKKLEIDGESRIEFAKAQTLKREVQAGRRAGETREQIRERLLAAGLDSAWLSDRGWGVDDVREGNEQREPVAQGGQDVERVAG